MELIVRPPTGTEIPGCQFHHRLNTTVGIMNGLLFLA